MKKFIFLTVISILTIVTAAGCYMDSADNLSSYSYSKDIKYSVSGTASTVDITMSNKDDNTEQKGDVSVPWSYSFTKTDSGYQFLYISAQNQHDTGTVTVKIVIDGETVETATSEGAYVIATASTSIGSY
jgi:hypothetical protein